MSMEIIVNQVKHDICKVLSAIIYSNKILYTTKYPKMQHNFYICVFNIHMQDKYRNKIYLIFDIFSG